MLETDSTIERVWVSKKRNRMSEKWKIDSQTIEKYVLKESVKDSGKSLLLKQQTAGKCIRKAYTD